MASLIDPSKPVAGHATTDSVRKNFQFAKQDIEYMQNQVNALVDRMQELENTVSEMQSKMITIDGGEIMGTLTVHGNVTLMAPVEMQSTVILHISPIGELEAAPKGYVDSLLNRESGNG